MQVATEHAEAVGECSRISMEEGFFLNGIALHPSGVSPGDIEFATAIEADPADAGLAVGNWAAVAAGIAADAIVAERLDEGRIGFADSLVENVA